jgi:hypothetical protein
MTATPGPPQGRDLHRGGDAVPQVEVQEHHVDREGGMADEFRPAQCRYDLADVRSGLPEPGLQGGQHHLLVVHDGQANVRGVHRSDGGCPP